MKLFASAVAWRANKQDTVTISFTETEPLTVLQITKEAIDFSCLIKVLTLILLEALMVKYNNQQTI